MSQLFHRYLTSPISALFLWIYETVAFHDFGFAVILLTVLVQAILSPLAYRDAKNQILLKKIQPRIKQI
jgi:YidC/Oxa1 family membrane protein insertase